MWPTGAAAVSVSCTRLAHMSKGGLVGRWKKSAILPLPQC